MRQQNEVRQLADKLARSRNRATSNPKQLNTVSHIARERAR